ncbi:MAG: hypothetical protein ACXV5T_09920 [Halobacteriota archaeon]
MPPEGFKGNPINVMSRGIEFPTLHADTAMSSNHPLREKGAKIMHDLVFVGLVLVGMTVLCIFKPRYISLIVRGYARAVRHKRRGRT